MSRSADFLPIQLPPSPFVRALGERLEPGVPRTILDVGCHTGRHSLYLASLGHEVVGISNDEEEVRRANHMQQELGLEHCTFEVGDARNLAAGRLFDIVVVTEMLHEMPKHESTVVLEGIRKVTKQGGLNAVSGYVLRPWEGNARNRARMFGVGELRDSYALAGWQVIDYAENHQPVRKLPSGREDVQSKVHILAARPW